MPFFETVFDLSIVHSATDTQTSTISQPSSVCVFGEQELTISLIQFIWRSVSEHSTHLTSKELLFIATVHAHDSRSWAMRLFDYRYRQWIFRFFSHFCSFVRQSWFATSDGARAFSLDDFVLYGTSVNHILCEAIYDHPLRLPHQWVYKQIVVNPLFSEFYWTLK